MAFIKIISGQLKGTRFDIDRDEIIIGRAPDNPIAIVDESVSGKHCAIIKNGNKYLIRDLGSTNGVLLNGNPIVEKQLQPKDTIMIGNVEVIFDGDDIETPQTNDIAQSTEKTSSTITTKSSIPQTIAFHKRKKRKWIANLSWIILAILTTIALIYFAYILIIQK